MRHGFNANAPQLRSAPKRQRKPFEHQCQRVCWPRGGAVTLRTANSTSKTKHRSLHNLLFSRLQLVRVACRPDTSFAATRVHSNAHTTVAEREGSAPLRIANTGHETKDYCIMALPKTPLHAAPIVKAIALSTGTSIPTGRKLGCCHEVWATHSLVIIPPHPSY